MKKQRLIFLIAILFLQLACVNVIGQTTQPKIITILHTNDTHSRIEQLSKSDKKYPNRAGYANRSAIIHKIRAQQPNVLLVDAGDFFQGTPYFNFYMGTLEVALMNKLGYKAVTLGNHEFDLGVDHLAKKLKKAKFAVVNCNYDVSKTALRKIVKPWIVVTIAGVKIGITGVGVNPEGLITPENFTGIVYHDPIIAVNSTAKMLKIDKKCDYVVCLSHLGYQQAEGVPSDIELAKRGMDIDLIIGGHSHTLLEHPDSVVNSCGKLVYVTQCGSMGVSLGRMDVEFRRK